MSHSENLLDSFQHLKIFSLRHEISVPANQASVQTVEPAVERCSVLAVVYDHFDTACAEHDTVSAHELAAAVHCVEVYFQVASEPATRTFRVSIRPDLIGQSQVNIITLPAADPETATSVAVVALDITMGRFAGEALASAEEY